MTDAPATTMAERRLQITRIPFNCLDPHLLAEQGGACG